MFMPDEKNKKLSAPIYLSLKRNVVVENNRVCMKDMGEVYCEEKEIMEQVQNYVIAELKQEETKVISLLYVIERIQKRFPGKIILSFGEKDVIISAKKKREGKLLQLFKVLLISFVIFFGTAFTIMSFHGDIGIEKMFGSVYEQVTGEVSDGTTVLELSYTIGIVIGILVFFNHISGKKVTPQPTPVQVQMRDYEMKTDQAFIENVGRKGSEESVK